MPTYIVESVIIEKIIARDDGQARKMAHERMRHGEHRYKISQRIVNTMRIPEPEESRMSNDEIVAQLRALLAEIERNK